MIIRLDDYRDRTVDPTAPFVPVIAHDELLENADLDPVLSVPAGLDANIARARVTSALRLQQHLVYRLGAHLGVLRPVLGDVLGALKSSPNLSALSGAAMTAEAVATAIGIASDAISALPLVGWIVKAASTGVQLAIQYAQAISTPGTMIGKQLVDAHRYSTDSDTSLVNTRLLVQSATRDWTSMFMPSMRGQLAAQVRKDRSGRLVIAWGLRDDGVVPRVVIDDRPLLKPYTWHFSHEGGSSFSTTGGMGAVPGSSRIVSVVQSVMLELQNLHRGHESLGDPRCGSSKKTADVDVGSWYPDAANGAWSLFAYCTKPSAATYTLATQEIANAWSMYMDAIWEGIERLWRNESWEGGWGCGVWQNSLQGLAAAHCVGMDGVIGGFGAWMPPQSGNYRTKLTSADRDAWEKNNLYTQIVKPAMVDLREMQLDLLRRTPMAAYIPRDGLGSMRDPSVLDEFSRARKELVQSASRSSQLLLSDVIDDHYLRALQVKQRGTNVGDGGIRDADYKPPRLPVPKGGKLGLTNDGGGSGDGGGGVAIVLAAAVAAWIWSRR